MAKAIVLKTNKGEQTFMVKDLSFVNMTCDLEDKGIDVMALTTEGTGNGKTMTTVRAILAALIGVDDIAAGNLLSEHLMNGGNFDTIMDVFAGAMKAADFGQTPQKQESDLY